MAGDLFRIELSYILMMLIKQGITTTMSPLPLLPRIISLALVPPHPPPTPRPWIPPTPRILPPPPPPPPKNKEDNSDMNQPADVQYKMISRMLEGAVPYPRDTIPLLQANGLYKIYKLPKLPDIELKVRPEGAKKENILHNSHEKLFTLRFKRQQSSGFIASARNFLGFMI